MDIHELIIDADTITTNEPAAPKKPRKAPAAPVWEVVLQDHCDAAVRRTTPKTKRLLVLLMSKNLFYIKDERTDEVTQLDAASLWSFMKGCDLTSTRFVPWCMPFDGSRRGAEHFCECIGNEDLQWLALRGLHVMDYDCGRYGYNDRPGALESKRKKFDNPINRTVRKVVEEVLGRERAEQLANGASPVNESEAKAQRALDREYVDELGFFNDKFGLDWMRSYLREFITAPFVGLYMPNISYCGDALFNAANFEPGRFIEYLLHDSVRMGYGIDYTNARRHNAQINDFVRTWGDTLRMQKLIRGRVYDKYPDELDSMHRKLSFRLMLMRHVIDERMFSEQSEKLSKYAMHDAYYLVRPPYNKDDMLDEATQQANCLASYLDVYTEGKSGILFLRASIDPDKSLVTVEIRERPDGSVYIRQAYARCNQRPGDDEVKWLAKWAEKFGIEMLDVDAQHPMVP